MLLASEVSHWSYFPPINTVLLVVNFALLLMAVHRIGYLMGLTNLTLVNEVTRLSSQQKITDQAIIEIRGKIDDTISEMAKLKQDL